MSNVIDQLAGLRGGPGQPASDDIIRRDLARGRAARRRRAFRRTATGLGATAAVAVAAAAVVGQQLVGSDGGLDLVAYHGDQLPGFTVGKVPEGFTLQGSNSRSLDIARANDDSALDNYDGKLVVVLRSVDATRVVPGKAVEVNGHRGTISKADPGATQLYYSDGTHDIVIQSATKLGLTNEELVEFASAVTVTADAEAGRG